MTTRTLDLSQPLPYAEYVRMSSAMQNPRSPEQQDMVIQTEITRQNRIWFRHKLYRDEGITGRLLMKRPAFRELLNDVAKTPPPFRLLLVDTIDRFGRHEEMDQVRAYLERRGVLLLVAEQHFEDPRTPSGDLLTKMDQWRGKRENDVKGHMVSRGKRDALELGYWPGGPVPLFLRLYQKNVEQRRFKQIIHHGVEPDPALEYLGLRMFELADVQGMAGVRIANIFNNDPTIPERLKPFYGNTIDRMLSNRLYIGEYVRNRYFVHYDNDVRAIEENSMDEWERFPNFCRPMIEVERFDRVQLLKEFRSAKMRAAREPAEKTCSSGVRGIPVKYVLSGLVICGECGSSMIAQGHRSPADDPLKGVYYRCPRHANGSCVNQTCAPYRWMLGEVTSSLFGWAFGGELPPNLIDSETVTNLPMFSEFVRMAQAEFQRQSSLQPLEVTALKDEKDRLVRQQQGWRLTLGDPGVSPTLRQSIQIDYESAASRIGELDRQLQQINQRSQTFDEICSPEQVAAVLCRIKDVIGGENACAANLELAKHLETITVFRDRRVCLRFCRVGLVGNATQILVSNEGECASAARVDRSTKRRLRPKRMVPDDNPTPWIWRPQEIATIDLDRFSDVPEDWFWTVDRVIPSKLTWPEQNGLEVARYRIENPCTIDKLEARFGVARRTIYSALDYAKKHGIDATQFDGRKFGGNWARDHAIEVLNFFNSNGRNIALAARHFGKSTPWIREALKYAKEQRNTHSEIPALEDDSDPVAA